MFTRSSYQDERPSTTSTGPGATADQLPRGPSERLIAAWPDSLPRHSDFDDLKSRDQRTQAGAFGRRLMISHRAKHVRGRASKKKTHRNREVAERTAWKRRREVERPRVVRAERGQGLVIDRPDAIDHAGRQVLEPILVAVVRLDELRIATVVQWGVSVLVDGDVEVIDELSLEVHEKRIRTLAALDVPRHGAIGFVDRRAVAEVGGATCQYARREDRTA